MRVFYLRDKSGFPIATVATEKATKVLQIAPNALELTPMIAFAVSTYNPNDPFVKSEGRKTAIAKLLNGQIAGAVFAHGDVKDNVLLQIANADVKVIPDKTRKAAYRMWQERQAERLLDDLCRACVG